MRSTGRTEIEIKCKLSEPISKLKPFNGGPAFIMPDLFRHPVNNCFNWIPAFAGMTGVIYIQDCSYDYFILR
jgi:hypothetical protein